MAAGLGFKDFTTGEVLTANDVDGYLMQGVWVFADAAARTAAVTSPQEGNMSYLKSDDAVYKYNGSAWVNIDTSAAASVNKNYLINGGFAVAQRGASFTSTDGGNNDDAYTLDRWYILSDGNDAIDVTQDTTTVPTNGEFAIALDVETVNKKFGIATIIENKDVIGLVGNTVTFSFKAKVSATTKLDNVKAAIIAWSGTADSVTSDIISAWGVEGTNPTLIANATYENTPANLNLTTSYATYSVSATVDTASTQNLILFIWSDVTDTTAGDFLYIAESKLEVGSSPTAFVYAGGTFQGELAACQRYYQEYGSDGSNYITTAAASGGNINATVYFPVKMRISPSASHNLTNANYASAWGLDVAYVTSNVAKTGTVTVNTATTTTACIISPTGATWASTPNILAILAGVGYLKLSAEL
jgi:hypothetical protein